jgi:hypothetical protein
VGRGSPPGGAASKGWGRRIGLAISASTCEFSFSSPSLKSSLVLGITEVSILVREIPPWGGGNFPPVKQHERFPILGGAGHRGFLFSAHPERFGSSGNQRPCSHAGNKQRSFLLSGLSYQKNDTPDVVVLNWESRTLTSYGRGWSATRWRWDACLLSAWKRAGVGAEGLFLRLARAQNTRVLTSLGIPEIGESEMFPGFFRPPNIKIVHKQTARSNIFQKLS